MNTGNKQSFSSFEALEARQMMTHTVTVAAPVTISTVAYDGGTQLEIDGTTKADNINVSPAVGGFKITEGTWSKTVLGTFNSIVVKTGRGNDVITIDSKVTTPAFLYGGVDNDTLTGGSGNDKLYGQGGTDMLYGGAGDDILVNVGDSASDRATGGTGLDTFWVDTNEKVTDASADEIAQGAVHRVSNFASYTTVKNTKTGATHTVRPTLDLDGGDLPDPGLDDASAKYTNFSKNPLFSSTGPSADDIAQGYLGDCWYLSTLAAIARTHPAAIKQDIVELGDGTYAVQFANANGTKAFVRVDGDLPTSSWGGLQYANLGKQGSVWVAIMEKAYACFRQGGLVNYSDLDGGWMSEAFTDLGYDNEQIWNVANGDDLLNQIDNELKAGKAVTMAINTPATGAPVIGSHAYTVISVDTDAQGHKTLVLRNPWGIDGIGNDGNDDGYVRLTPVQAFGSFWGVISSNVA
jgi:hypothetical protein